jgi:hypothetical protein
LLQLDSTFSEREYGASSFRDFMEKVAQTGAVTLKSAGRSMMVESREGGDVEVASSPVDTVAAPLDKVAGPVSESIDQTATEDEEESLPRSPMTMQDGIRAVQQAFANGTPPPRWPMYVRQVKQYLRSVDQAFDERKFGFHGLNDLLRACQREGLFRVERDRQGVVRFFQGNVMKADEAAAASGINRADIEAAERLAQAAEAELAEAEARQDVVDGDVVREEEPQRIVDVEASTEDAPPEAPPEEPAKGSRRKRASTPRAGKPKEPGEKKAARPRGGKRKVAVAADA